MYFPQEDRWGFERWIEESLDSDLRSLAKEEKQRQETKLQEQQVEEGEEIIATIPDDHLDDSEQLSLEQEQSATDTVEDVAGKLDRIW